MKCKTSASHDEMMIKELRRSQKFAVEYLKAAMEDTEEPQSYYLWRYGTSPKRGVELPKSPNRPELNARACIAPVAPRQPATFDVICRHQSDGFDTDGSGGWAMITINLRLIAGAA